MSKVLIPVRMLNEYTYCPRLFHLEHVQSEWADNADTAEGSFVHRRVDRPSREGLPEAEAAEAPRRVRSVQLADEELGLTGKLDLVEADGGAAVPVDYKRGAAPDIPEGAYEPERVQICAQALLLRAHGWRCERGVLYFSGSRTRVDVPITEDLVSRTLALLEGARELAGRDAPPPPLPQSPKCPRCSLVGICLPDEVGKLSGAAEGRVRRLVPPRLEKLPLVVQGHGLTVRLSGGELRVTNRKREVLESVRLMDISDVVLMGRNQVTTPALTRLMECAIPVSWFSYGGWFQGMAHGMPNGNALLRRAQFRAADDPERALALARSFIAGKIANQRTLIRRNHSAATEVLREMKRCRDEARGAGSIATLLGIEGAAARAYFSALPGLLKPKEFQWPAEDLFSGRNRRPPRDPVNALLSFGYAVLTREVTHALFRAGLDPFVGYLHQPRSGRPALALDLMEEFRPLVVDSAVLLGINTGVFREDDFIVAAGSVALTKRGRKALLEGLARRLDELVTHPVFRYRVSYRRIIDVQARLLGRHVLEGTPYVAFCTR